MERHSTRLLTVLSFNIFLAILWITNCQSGLFKGVSFLKCNSFCSEVDSSAKSDILKFPFDRFAILSRQLPSAVIFSLEQQSCRIDTVSCKLGDGTLTSKQRDLIGAMILDIESHSIISLMLPEYFSIVLLNAAWASLVNESASLMITHL